MAETSALNTTPQATPPQETRTRQRAEETRTENDKPERRDIVKKETVEDKIGQKAQAEAAIFHKDKLVVEKEEPPAQPPNNDISSRKATTAAGENLTPLPEVQPQATPPPTEAVDQGAPSDVAVEPPDATTTTRDTIETAVAQREQEQAFENAAEAGVEEIEARPPAEPTQRAPQPTDKEQVKAQERADSSAQNKPVADREIGGTVDVAI